MSQSPSGAKQKLINLLSLNSSALQLALLIRLQEFVIGHLRSWSRRRVWVCCITRGARASPGKRNEPLVFGDDSGVEHNSRGQSTPGLQPPPDQAPTLTGCILLLELLGPTVYTAASSLSTSQNCVYASDGATAAWWAPSCTVLYVPCSQCVCVCTELLQVFNLRGGVVSK